METVIDALEKRGFIDAISSDELRERVKQPLKLYIGFDPTANSLHLGNLVGIIALAWFQKYGHTPVILLGGGTGKIGDPSGKDTERPLLDENVLKANVEGIRKQFERCLDFSHPTAPPMMVNNDDWLSSYSLIEFLRDVGKHFRLGPMLGKDSVRSRLNSEEGMSFTEFSYQVLQGYDFYHLYKENSICLQMGGSDQWGNITAGIELTRKLIGESVFGMTYPLLTRSDGKKFGKSEEGAIWLDPEKTSPYQFYQHLIRVADADVTKLMRMLTFIDVREIEAFEAEIASGEFIPFAAQKRLAEEVTRFVHGEEGVQIALRVTAAIAPGSNASLDPEILEEIARDMPHVALDVSEVLDQKYTDVITKAGFVTSKSEAARLIQNGGAYLNNEKVEDPAFTITKKHLIGNKYVMLGSGKKKKMLIKIAP
ncbi:tyrosine--tRNA ligase [Simkania negevensis]|uniref:Tyrosine--tRNA ligase n=1 Tax=Simkania negevensis (strain ATCC VR-1471 / DSM 27360 / Z) TaxID=331113 RepID=F8L7E4_SIMNZ|nr:tyrosine--tRNA ligase [Simkania negevensis]CCB88674.1 tyrosyl-tRNA synthetase [Simkania negevensis Z]